MYKIMLADDEGIVIDSLKFIIENNFKDSCEIQSAKTGRSVIELAENFRPDIALMDIQMPGINGIEAMKEIRHINSNMVFIVLSAYDKFDYAKEAINLGVIEYLNKPFDQETIIGVLKRAMGIIDSERKKRSDDLLIKEKLETVVPIIENGLIQNLLFHEHFTEDVDNYKELLGINDDYGYMAVIVSGEEQVGNYMRGAVAASIKTQKEYKEIREIAGGYFHGIVGCVMANKIPVLITCKEESLPYDERTTLIEHAREMVRKLTDRFSINFRIGIGGIRPLSSIAESYSEALAVLVRTTGRVAHVDDVPVGCEYEDNYPVKLEKNLFDEVKGGDVSQAVKTANKFFDWMDENYRECPTDIKLKVLEFVLWAEHLAYENGGNVYHFRSRSDYLPQISSMDSLDQLRLWFTSKIEEASKMINTDKDEKSVSTIEQAKRYIEANYNKEISLDDVSREVDISPYYFSKLFKDETGVNFIEYLTNIRLDRAKELLGSSDLSMKEICLEIGYADPNYFSRMFKKNLGVTPTEFKEGKTNA